MEPDRGAMVCRRMANRKLSTYQAKRDFTLTAEPSGEAAHDEGETNAGVGGCGRHGSMLGESQLPPSAHQLG